MNYRFIAIEGNIGSGKTTLAMKLASSVQGSLLLERFEDNSFLPKFYQDPARYAFTLELSFLADRYQQIREKTSTPALFDKTIIADYFIDKSWIFAGVTLNSSEFGLFKRLFDIIYPTLPKPDLIIYLHSTPGIVEKRIKIRGRDYERGIPIDYLQSIHDKYISYFRQHPGIRVLSIDIAHHDLIMEPEKFKKLLTIIQEDLPEGMNEIDL
ncbi:MAG: deoxynucleoside kinase [Bacteroidetes bacterium]|nr:deoxynucleoside kinase [Bacteroidota bacterium]